MKRKILVGIVLIAVTILTLTFLILTQSIPSDPKIALEISNIAIKETSEYYIIKITISLPQNHTTLYNCRIEVKYLTESNVWKTTVKDIGIINYGDYKDFTLRLDSDFKSGNPYLKPDDYFHGDVEPNVKVEAYGYAKP